VKDFTGFIKKVFVTPL